MAQNRLESSAVLNMIAPAMAHPHTSCHPFKCVACHIQLAKEFAKRVGYIVERGFTNGEAIGQYVIECIEALTKFSMKPIPMMAKVGGVLGTLRYPRLIRPYSAHYGHPVAYYRALGARILLSGPLMGCLQLPVFPIYLNL